MLSATSSRSFRISGAGSMATENLVELDIDTALEFARRSRVPKLPLRRGLQKTEVHIGQSVHLRAHRDELGLDYSDGRLERGQPVVDRREPPFERGLEVGDGCQQGVGNLGHAGKMGSRL
jgi:hypothetical protein